MATDLNKTFDCAVIAEVFICRGTRYWKAAAVCVLMAFLLIGFITSVSAQSNIRATKHNLSSSGTGSVKATTETQVCVFCHTPHGASISGKAPLWNRTVNAAQTYTRYTSSSLDANNITDGFSAQPGGSSVLCLSCHDGMIALGNVNVLNGVAGPPSITGLTGTMPTGSGVNTGFTRNLGTDLSNDHPISITYNDALAVADGEMTRLSTADPKQQNTAASGTAGRLIGIRSSGYKPLLPLEPTHATNAGQVQCATCHDPHITKEKFLRLNRFQTTAAPSGTTFNEANDQICLACHPKLWATWAQSAHANTTSAAYEYKTDASVVRDFPTGTPNKKVWEVGCLNCHDTHTVSGSRRLLREGTGTTPSATSAAFQAGSITRPLENVSAIENTCYQCHNTPNNGGLDTVGATILKSTTLTATTGVPDIFTEFGRAVRMPIKTIDQNDVATAPANTNTNITEIHDITDSNFTESQLKLGRGNTMNRHVECTDCHNPHRVIKNSLVTGGGSATQRTHTAGGATGNIASGVLRGAWGVEPVFAALGNTWPQAPSSFTLKKGDPGIATLTDSGQAYLTREYQLCFKCHSNYANGDTAGSFPLLGNTGGGTSSGTNGMLRYTNVAAEFGSVNATALAEATRDQAEYGESSVATEDTTGLEPAGSYPADTDPGGSMTDIAGTQNHRSWHPVMWPTGRTLDERRISDTTYNFRTPFAANVGTQTMHCSDCHGQSTSWTTDTGPNLAQVQGPHGSSNNFLLKGTWSTSNSIGSPGFCGNCHNPTTTGSGTGDGLTNLRSGFNNAGTNSQGGHGNAHNGKSCMRCHIAVPHGWKNKAFLVNLNCVGTEGGQASECVTVSGAGNGGTGAVTMAPYYISSYLRVAVWRASGNWSETSCGMASGGSKGPGKDWMTDGGTC